MGWEKKNESLFYHSLHTRFWIQNTWKYIRVLFAVRTYGDTVAKGVQVRNARIVDEGPQ